MGEVPLVDLFLQLVARAQQFAIGGRQFVDQGLEIGPEAGRIQVYRRQEFVLDEVEKGRVDPETTDFPPAFFFIAHDTCLLCDELFFLGAAFHRGRR